MHLLQGDQLCSTMSFPQYTPDIMAFCCLIMMLSVYVLFDILKGSFFRYKRTVYKILILKTIDSSRTQKVIIPPQ